MKSFVKIQGELKYMISKLKSIDTIIYIIATFFWMVLTLSMILLLLIASYINESSTCSIALGIVFAGIVALFLY